MNFPYPSKTPSGLPAPIPLDQSRGGRPEAGNLLGRPECIQDLLILRKTIVLLVLAEDHLAVSFDVENAATTFDELGLDSQFSLQECRQTGGFWVIVSLNAVRD